MTKGELLEMLAPFTEDIEILIAKDSTANYHGVHSAMYAMTGPGDGMVILQAGETHSLGMRFTQRID
jgi:hypothetical protein